MYEKKKPKLQNVTDHMARLTSYDPNIGLLVDEEERLLSSKGFIDEDEMYKIMRHLAEKLYEYENLEEQGLLLRLPCKIGDTVYSLDRFCGGYSSDCPSRPCKTCPDYELEIYERTFRLQNIPDFGKTIFLTRTEAEEALKKNMQMEDVNNEHD